MPIAPTMPENSVQVSLSVIDAFLHKVHGGFDTMSSIEQGVWREILSHINEATVSGLLEAKAVPTHNGAFLSALRHSNEVFAAFKVHALQQEVAAKLLTPDGQLKSFDQFRRDVEGITSHQCGAWLQTEYDTAVIRAHNAADWQVYEANRDIMPNLRWLPTTAAEPEAGHRAYWVARLNLPMDDPFWQHHHPGDHWNCKCSLEQNNDPVVRPSDIPDDTPQPGLDNNPGKDGHTFSDKHPYFPTGCSSCPFNKSIKNTVQTLFKNQKKHCYQCDKVNKAIGQSGVKEAKTLVDTTAHGMKARKVACTLGSFSDKEVNFFKRHGIELVSTDICISDERILHALRDFKKNSGKAVSPGELKFFIENIASCSMYFDTEKANIIFATNQNGRMQKFVIEPNYKIKANGTKFTTNAFVTAGITLEHNLNESKYIKIR